MDPRSLYLDYIRALISITMLGYASYKDMKTREIQDIVWIVPGAVGLLLGVYELFLGSISLQGVLFSIGFMVMLSGILWFLRLFGEADLIAFVTLAVIHPRTPVYGFIGDPPLFFSFTLIANSAIAGLFTAFYTFIVNLLELLRGKDLFDRYSDVSVLRKIAILFTGRNMSMERVRGPPFEYPLEVKGELIIKPDLFDDEAANKEFRILREKGANMVWVSATLPYIVVLFVGYLISILYGDVIFSIMSILV
ncbi:A24 family peptidase C-terminal domain-containing protein [Thermoproteota archaeon]